MEQEKPNEYEEMMKSDEDFEEERFFMIARVLFWTNSDGSRARAVAGTLIEVLEF